MATITRRTAAEEITRFLAKRTRPVTAAFIAEKTGLNLNTVRTTLLGLGAIQTVGTETATRRGRPSNLYKLAA